MQQIWLALIIGLILGWLIEWLIDWRYWRRHLTALRTENVLLRRQLDEYHASQPVPSVLASSVLASSSLAAETSASADASAFPSDATTTAVPAE